MELLSSILTFLFGFTMGGILFLVAGVGSVLYLINQMQDKTTEFRARVDKSVVDSKKLNSEVLESYLRLQSWALSYAGPMKGTPWRYASLKENVIQIFSDNTKENLEEEIVLDGCSINLTNKNWASSMNAIEIDHPTRFLLDTERTKKICLYFATGWEMEMWYWSICRGAVLGEAHNLILEQEGRAKHHFTNLCHQLLPNGPDGEREPEAWINAALSRFWWNLFENKSFHKFVVKRLGKRIAKITDFPKFIQSMILASIHIGPNLPTLKNIQLVNLLPDGTIDLDADVEYTGGLSLTIQLKTSLQLPGTSVELPASANILVNHLSGKLRVHVSAPPCERFWVGFHEMPETDVIAETQIGNVNKDTGMAFAVPKMAGNIVKKLRADITRIIVNKLKSDIIGEKMVLPNMDDFPIPYFTHHEGEDNDDYVQQVILSREDVKSLEERKQTASVLDISPAGVTILNKRIDSDQIVPLLKSYASREGVRKLATTVHKNMPSKATVIENMEKGKQAIVDSGMTNMKNWKANLPAKDELMGGIRQIAMEKPRDSLPPDFNEKLLRMTSAPNRIDRKRSLDEEKSLPLTHSASMEKSGSRTSSATTKERSFSLAQINPRKEKGGKELKKSSGSTRKPRTHSRKPSSGSFRPSAGQLHHSADSE